jgi:hypothetical protein
MTPLFQTPPAVSLGTVSAPNNADYEWILQNAADVVPAGPAPVL